MLQICFLGTGTSQGVPVIGSSHPVCQSKDPKDHRLRVSISISWKEGGVVIDCGPDFRQQLLRQPIAELSALLFTHEHADHTAGLDDIRPFYFRQGPIDVYADTLVEKALKQRFAYFFETENRYPGVPELVLHSIDKTTAFEVKGKRFIPIEVLHGKLPVLGFRVDDFAYLTDVKTIAKAEKEKLQGLEVLVVNALRKEPHPTHLNLEEALALVAELQPKRTYFTHISHRMGFYEEVSKTLPENVFLAYDTLTIHV